MRVLTRLMVGALLLAIGGSFLTAAAASVGVPVSAVGQGTFATVPNDFAPPECSAIVLTSIVSGNGTINGAGGVVNELITGGAGADTINGFGGDDCIIAGGGNDSVDGDVGDDVLMGDGGDDTLNGNVGSDTLYGGAGTGDVCSGGPGQDTFPDGTCETTQQE